MNLAIVDAQAKLVKAVREDERERVFTRIEAELKRWEPRERGIRPDCDPATVTICANQVRWLLSSLRGGG